MSPLGVFGKVTATKDKVQAVSWPGNKCNPGYHYDEI